MLPFPDRARAGELLGEAVAELSLTRPLVLGIPRGGVLVAAPVARATGGELDVIVVRKIGAPANPELGIGAVGPTGDAVLDRVLIEALGVREDYLEAAIERERREVHRRLEAYRGGRPLPDPAGRDVVVVDDGIATGGTVSAAGRALRAAGPARLVLAVPVAPAESLVRVGEVYDRVVCLATPSPFAAVGQWYDDFHQVSDEEVRAALAA